VPGVAAANVEEVIESELPLTTTVIAAEVTWVGLLLSLTVVVKLEVPVDVGTPEMTPVELERLSPEGSEPDAIAHLYIKVPPVATKPWE
jgi:hypothetical protein